MATILIVGLGTFVIGLMPTYERIGFWAPLALALIRILQGFGVGGEPGRRGADDRRVRAAPRRGFYASWVHWRARGLRDSGRPVRAADVHAQRIADAGLGLAHSFLLSLVLVIIGLYVRLRIDESPVFEEIRKTKAVESRPVTEVCAHLSRHHHQRRIRQSWWKPAPSRCTAPSCWPTARRIT